MAQIKKVNAVWWEVKATIPREDGKGKDDVQRFHVKFDLLPMSVINEALKASKSDDEDDAVVLVVADHIKDWKGLEDDGENYPCTSENIAEMMELSYYAKAIAAAFYKCQSGARSKN